MPSASRFSSGTNSPLYFNDRNRNTTDTGNNSSNAASSYSASTLSPSGTVSPNANQMSSRYEMSSTVPNYNRYRIANKIKVNVFSLWQSWKQKTTLTKIVIITSHRVPIVYFKKLIRNVRNLFNNYKNLFDKKFYYCSEISG